MRYFMVWIAVLWHLTAVGQPTAATKYDFTYYKRALIAHNKGEYRTAILDYSIFIKDNPPHANALLQRGNCYLMTKDYGRAMTDFKALQRLSPTEPDGVVGEIKVYVAQKNYAQSLAIADKAAEQYAGAHSIYWERARVHYALGVYEKAFADWYKLAGRDSLYATISHCIGTAILAQQSEFYKDSMALETAAFWFSKMLMRDSVYTPALRNRAVALYYLGREAEAMADIRAALRINPNDGYAYLYAGKWAHRAGDREACAANIRQATALLYKSNSLEELRVLSAIADKDYVGAMKGIDFLDKNTDEDTAKGYTAYLKAILYAAQGDRQGLKALREAGKRGLFVYSDVCDDLQRNPIFELYYPEKEWKSLLNDTKNTPKQPTYFHRIGRWLALGY
jgi:tetratricopeptide (TPR) repeat protein